MLLRAFDDVPGRLLIAGSGPQEAELRSQTNGRVQLLGQLAREELPQLYASADCFVLPSRSEPWGMVLNEAAASGLPLVASEAAGGGYDLIEDGVNGYRVPVDDASALAQALTKVAVDPALAPPRRRALPRADRRVHRRRLGGSRRRPRPPVPGLILSRGPSQGP